MSTPVAPIDPPRLVTRPAFVVVGLRIRATPMSPEIPRLWQGFAPRIDEVPDLAEPRVSYGVIGGFDPQQQRFDYMAGVSVTRTGRLPDGMVAWELPGQTYAVFDARLRHIGEAFGHIFGAWLPTAGFRQADAPYFERYGASFDPGNPDSGIEIFIPVHDKVA